MTGRLDLSHLRNAIVSLEEGMGTASDVGWFSVQSSAVQNTLIAGVIQNFEFVYELSVKMIRRQFEREALSPEEVDQDNYREILRSAAERGLVADVEAWFGYRAMRNTMSRTYNHEKARLVYQGIAAFIVDARDLLIKLEQRSI